MPFTAKLANFDLSGLPDVISKANKRTANNEARRFRESRENWSEENKAVFNVTISSTKYGIDDYSVSTDSMLYRWIDEGTDPHTITPNGPYALKIRGGQGGVGNMYQPKTRANQIKPSGSGTYTEGDWYGESVTQSIEPRNFTKIILEKAPGRWERALDTEIKLYLKQKVK